MTDLSIHSATVAAALKGIPLADDLLSSLRRETALEIAVFGGTIRDILFCGEPGRDLDILVFGDSHGTFKSGVERVAAKFSAKMIDYPGSHVVLVTPQSAVTFDVHYPKKTFLEGLVRSDFTVNGIGFRWKEQMLDDPFDGVSHLTDRKLLMHSPQYVLTNPPNFPRMFRTAAKLGFSIEGETERILRQCAGMITLHDGKTNIRTLLEFVKFLSLPTIAPYLRQFNQLRLIEGIFPELIILGSVASSQKQTALVRNVELAAMFDSLDATEEFNKFLHADVGLGITNLGFVRLMTLFIDLGIAYAGFRGDAPYIKAVANGDLEAFGRRMERNLLPHIGARFREASDFATLFNEMPVALAYLYEVLKSSSAVVPEALSKPTQVRIQVLATALRSIKKS